MPVLQLQNTEPLLHAFTVRLLFNQRHLVNAPPIKDHFSKAFRKVVAAQGYGRRHQYPREQRIFLEGTVLRADKASEAQQVSTPLANSKLLLDDP